MLCSDERKASPLQQRQKRCFTMLPIFADMANGARRPGISQWNLGEQVGSLPGSALDLKPAPQVADPLLHREET
jgi:hypothetical protein